MVLGMRVLGAVSRYAGTWPRIAERPLARRHMPFAEDQVLL